MNLLKVFGEELSRIKQDAAPSSADSDQTNQPKNFSSFALSSFTLKKMRGSLLLLVGYLLSPLCWWNDLVFNLPVAYVFGYICSCVSASWFMPGLIAGYWLSNLAGILLMQFGAIDMLQGEAKPHNLKKDLITGIVSSTIYTFVILALVQLHIIDPSAWLPSEGLPSLSSLWTMSVVFKLP